MLAVEFVEISTLITYKERTTGSQTANTSVSSGGGSLSVPVRLKGHYRGR